MGTLVAVRAGPETSGLLRQSVGVFPDVPLEEVAGPEELIARMERGDQVDAVVLGPDLEEPVRIAQRVHSLDKYVAVLILSDSDRCHQIARALQFAPLLGEDVGCWSVAEPETVVGEAKEAVGRARKRRSYRATIAAASAGVAAISPPRPRAEQYLDRLLDHAPIGIVAVDERGLILAWNRKTTEILGRSEREVVGTTLTRLFPEGERGKLERSITGCLISGEQSASEPLRRETAEGRVQFVEATTAALAGRTGERGAMVLIQDVTERINFEEELHRSNERVTNILESISDAFYALDREWRFTYVNRHAEQLWDRHREELLGRNIWEVFPQAVGSQSYRQITRAMEEGITTSFETMSPVLDTWIAGRAYPSMDGLSVYFQDVTDRKRVEEEMRARTRQQKAVADLGQRALATADLQRLLEEATRLVAGVLGLEYCNVLELLPGGEKLLLRAGVGWKEGYVGQAKVRAGRESQSGYTLLSDEPVIVENLRHERRFVGPPYLREHDVVSGMSVIIGGREHPFGVLGVHTKKQRQFTGDDVNFLQAVANVLATAVERGRNEEALREIQRAERQRVGRDLHDVVLQDLGGAVQALQLTQLRAKRSGSELDLEEELQALRRATTGLRSAVYDLRFEKEQAFVKATESLVELSRRMAPGRHVELTLEEGFPRDLPDPVGVELLRVIQEALTNARRHSGAKRIGVNLRLEGEEVWAEVSDDGRGFEPGASKGGVGLSTMRERTEALGGHLEVWSRPGEGTRVMVRVPLEDGTQGPRRL